MASMRASYSATIRVHSITRAEDCLSADNVNIQTAVRNRQRVARRLEQRTLPVLEYCLRDDPFEANVKTDLFALGCTIYFIMTGHAVFPDVVDGEEAWHETIERRFRDREFPQDRHVCDVVTGKCWNMEYEAAEDVVPDLESLEGVHVSEDGSELRLP
ncbi:predicted protein [Plenodomus lingam JN3]|uniref:Predicted protein n=1 Tax=Leptosphaeria maculans (strain JN3 / isolate v23.1.3 / race Av1-4-5-6-7-8) TaxID=985895 RepID=E5A468_LEPMJ|nr:predicted protein [Plenodomus lingam JN3]CBX98413.1 predicted protein [Plenodomus lingam JN3]